MIPAMAMTPDEKEQFNELREKVHRMEKEHNAMSKKIDSILNIVKGIAIGLIAGGVIFGYLQIKELVGVVK